jgi:hypothetical protein
MKYSAEFKFSDNILEDTDFGIDFIKRELALKIINGLPIEYLDALFNYNITYFSDRLTSENEYKHDLIRSLRQNRMNHMQAEIETKLP